LINKGIDAMTDEVIERLKDEVESMEQPLDSESDDEEEDDDDVDVDGIERDQIMDSMDLEDESYEMDIELSEDIKRLQSIQEKEWNDLEGEDKLFVFIQRETLHMVVTRGLAHSNLSQYQLAFDDAYLCTFSARNGLESMGSSFGITMGGFTKNVVTECVPEVGLMDKSSSYTSDSTMTNSSSTDSLMTCVSEDFSPGFDRFDDRLAIFF